MSKEYQPEDYWSEVGSRIEARDDGKNVIAGDDEPYYRYKRQQFLRLLRGVDFSGKRVLEIGPGPGGNLVEVFGLGPAELTGADISAQMVKLATSKVDPTVRVVKINGKELPFGDQSFDIVFTATVLQHNTDETMLKQIISELSRVSADKVYLFERIESTVKGDDLCYGRPVNYYSAIMEQHGFELESTSFINIRVSYYVSGAIRKLFNSSTRREGEPLNALSTLLQMGTLPFTRILDKLFTSKKDVARLTYRRVRT